VCLLGYVYVFFSLFSFLDGLFGSLPLLMANKVSSFSSKNSTLNKPTCNFVAILLQSLCTK